MPGYFDSLRAKFTGGGNQQQQSNQQQQNPGNNEDPNNLQGNTTPPGGGNNPNAGGNQGSSQGQDFLSALYTAKGKDPEATPTFALDDKNLQGLVDSQNFAGDISPEDMQKLQAGDFSVIGNMVNKASRAAYKAALQHSSTLTDKFVGARFEHSDKQFSSRVRQHGVESALSKLPNYSNPAVKQHLNDIANRLASQHPDASESDIAQEAQRILMEIANGVNPENTPEARRAKETQGQTDWSAWLKQDSGQPLQ